MKTRSAIGVLLVACVASVSAGAAAGNPTIALSTTNLVIQAPEGGPDPAYTPVNLENSGNAKLKWTAVSSQPTWLFVTPSGGELNPTGKQELRITVDVTTSGLPAGDHPATIQIKDPNATNSPVTINVTLKISSGPVISATPNPLPFSAAVGNVDPADKTLTIQNSGGGTLEWSAVCSPSWLSCDIPSGSLTAGASKAVKVSVHVAGLAAGTHPGTITITGTGASNSPVVVDVPLTLSQKAKIGLNPGGGHAEE
jgi:uncharacterized membrane protein